MRLLDKPDDASPPSDPHQVRMDLPVPLRLRPDVKSERTELVDVGDGFGVFGEAHGMKVRPARFARLYLNVLELGSRVVGGVPLFGLAARGAVSAGKRELAEAERTDQSERRAIFYGAQATDLRRMSTERTRARGAGRVSLAGAAHRARMRLQQYAREEASRREDVVAPQVVVERFPAGVLVQVPARRTLKRSGPFRARGRPARPARQEVGPGRSGSERRRFPRKR